MGMYTEFHGRVTLKPGIEKALTDKYDRVDLLRLSKIRVLGKHPDIKSFLRLSRCGSIGRTTTAYFPSEEVDNSTWEDTLSSPTGTNTWIFRCSLKNYEQEIEKFCSILPLIADGWRLFSLYEENRHDWHPHEYKPLLSSQLIKSLPNHHYPYAEFELLGKISRQLPDKKYLYSTVTPGKQIERHNWMF